MIFLKVKEEPLKDKDRHTYQVQSTYRHVSGRGREQIDVILHGASSLPDTESGTTPQAFVIVQVFTLTIWSILVQAPSTKILVQIVFKTTVMCFKISLS